MAAKKARKAASETKIYKMTELVGTSTDSFADAASAAVERACETLRNVDWFEVSEMRGAVQNGRIAHYQVKLKVGFRLE
jgi:flavin-binding protein dodecin